MILIVLKDSNKIQGFGKEYFEYGTGFLVITDTNEQMYVSKQNAEVIEYSGSFPYEDFEPYKYVYSNGQIIKDQNFVRPSRITEYGVPEDVVNGIKERAAEQELQNLVKELSEKEY